MQIGNFCKVANPGWTCYVRCTPLGHVRAQRVHAAVVYPGVYTRTNAQWCVSASLPVGEWRLIPNEKLKHRLRNCYTF